MVIGIKYMSGSIEEKANYKKTMIPYLIGCICIFGASTIAPDILETFKEISEPEEIGNLVLGAIQNIGTFTAVGILMILGIKYMLGSTEEKASYKKSMLPYFIGAILLFGAVNITAYIVETFALDGDYKGDMDAVSGRQAGEEYVKSHSGSEIYEEYKRVEEKYKEISDSDTASTDEIKYWQAYLNVLYEAIRWTYL